VEAQCREIALLKQQLESMERSAEELRFAEANAREYAHQMQALYTERRLDLNPTQTFPTRCHSAQDILTVHRAARTEFN
jgi:hypothetical protein